MMHFPNANIPEEIPVSLGPAFTNDTTALERNDQLVKPVDVCDEILPGLTPNCKDGSGSKSINHTLVMEAPVTFKENELTSDKTSHISTMLNGGSNPLNNSSVSSVMGRSAKSMLFSSTSPICTLSVSTPFSSNMISNSSSTPPICTSLTSTPISNSSSTPSICTSSTSTPPSSNMISKYLVQYVPVVSEKKKVHETRITGSRVLTSVEGIAILREKEENKKKEKEEKEKRKQERLNKKK